METLALILLLLLPSGPAVETTAAAGPNRVAETLDGLGHPPPGREPRLFAPDLVSTGLYERDVAMMPDGSEFYFGLLAGDYATIAVMTRRNGTWSGPRIAPFSTDPRAFDLEPHITPDGSRFLFLSTRPREGGDWKPGWANQDIWAMDRDGTGWGPPYNLGPPVDTEAPEFFPSTTRDGTLYFTREVEEGDRKRSLILRSRRSDGKYLSPEPLPPAVNAGDSQFNAFIDPDERFLIFGMTDREDMIGQVDYYIAFRGKDDSWTGPVNMGPTVNTPDNRVASPYISPDGRYFFFASTRKPEATGTGRRDYAALQKMRNRPGNGSSDIYWVGTAFIESLRPAAHAE